MGRLFLMALALCLVLNSGYAVSGASDSLPVTHIDIFTTEKGASGYKLTRLKTLVDAPIHVHHVDAIKNFEANMSKGLKFNGKPTNKQVSSLAKELNNKMASKKFAPERERLQKGVLAFEKAVQYNLTQVPAVVFNKKYIVYGERPLNALKIFKSKVRG